MACLSQICILISNLLCHAVIQKKYKKKTLPVVQIKYFYCENKIDLDHCDLNVTGQFSSVPGTSRMAALPGAGALTRSLKSRSAAWSESDFKLHGKLHVSLCSNAAVLLAAYLLAQPQSAAYNQIIAS